jgi:cysteine dioxygenase
MIHSLTDLITAIRSEFENKPTITECNIDRLQQLTKMYESNSRDWTEYVFFDQNKYTRNLVDDGNGHFNIIVLCWAPGQQSPIHDHANSHCLFKVLEGEMVETLYDCPQNTGEMTEKSCTVYETNRVNYMHDKIGVHRVGNHSSKPAISLHLYSPPILECRTYVQGTGQARGSGSCCFYSKYGKLCNIARETSTLLDIKKAMMLETKLPRKVSQFTLTERVPSSQILNNDKPETELQIRSVVGLVKQ